MFSAAAGSGLACWTLDSLDRPSTIGWLAAADAASWILTGAFYGAFAAFGAFAFLHLQHADVLHLGIPDAAAAALLLTILGPPLILLGQITGEMIFVGLTSPRGEFGCGSRVAGAFGGMGHRSWMHLAGRDSY